MKGDNCNGTSIQCFKPLGNCAEISTNIFTVNNFKRIKDVPAMNQLINFINFKDVIRLHYRCDGLMDRASASTRWVPGSYTTRAGATNH